MADTSQKTEQATPRRLEKARKEGQFPVSRDLVSAFEFLAFAALLANGGPAFFAQLREAMRWLFVRAFMPLASETDLADVVRGAALRVFVPLGIGAGVLLAVALGAQLSATKMGVSQITRAAPPESAFRHAGAVSDSTRRLRSVCDCA